MASNAQKGQQSSWLTWGGVSVVVLVALGALGYWMDWYGGTATESVAPAAGDAAPVSE